MRLERRDWRGPSWGTPWRLRWPVSGGCPRRMFGSALRWGRGWRSRRRAAAWLGARGPLCPQWGWRGWCSQCCPQGLGIGHPVLHTRMPERGQCYPDTLFRRRSNNLFWRRSSGRWNVAGTGCWNVAGTVENRHSSARAQGALRALRPLGGGGHPLQRILAPLRGWGTNNHWEFLGFPLPLDNKES